MDVGKLQLIEPSEYNEIYSVHKQKKTQSRIKIKLPKLENLTRTNVKSNNLSQNHYNLTQRDDQNINDIPQIIPYPFFKPNNIYKDLKKNKKYFNRKELSCFGVKELKLLREENGLKLENLYENIPIKMDSVNDYIEKQKNQFITYVNLPGEIIDFVTDKISKNNELNQTDNKNSSKILINNNNNNEKGRKLIIHNVFFEIVIDKIFRLIELDKNNKNISVILVKNLLNNEFEKMKKTLIEMDKNHKLKLIPKSVSKDKKIKNKVLKTEYSNYNEYMNYSNNSFNEREKYITDMIKKKFFNNSSNFSTEATTNLNSNYIIKISNDIEKNVESFRNKNYSSVFESEFEDQLKPENNKTANKGVQELLKKLIEMNNDKNKNNIKNNKRFKGINFIKKDYSKRTSLYKNNIIKKNDYNDNNDNNEPNLIETSNNENTESMINFIANNFNNKKILSKEKIQYLVNQLNKNGKDLKLNNVKDVNELYKLLILNNNIPGKNNNTQVIKNKNNDIKNLSEQKNKNINTDSKKQKNYNETSYFDNKSNEIYIKINNNINKLNDNLNSKKDNKNINTENKENGQNENEDNINAKNNITYGKNVINDKNVKDKNILTEAKLLSKIKIENGKIDLEATLNNINEHDNKNIYTNILIEKLITENDNEENNNSIQNTEKLLESNESMKAELTEKEINFMKETDNFKKLDQKYKILVTKLFNQLLKCIKEKNNNKQFLSKLHSLIENVITEIEKEKIKPKKLKNSFKYKYSKNNVDDKNSYEYKEFEEESENGENNLTKNKKIHKKNAKKYKYRFKSSNECSPKKLIYDNSYLFKNEKTDIPIKKEIQDIINSEYKPIKELDNDNNKFDANKKLFQKKIKQQKNKPKAKKQTTLLEFKTDIEDSNKNLNQLDEEEEKRKKKEQLSEQRLYDFFKKIQKLKKGITVEDELNLDAFIDDELDKKIRAKDIQREMRANNFLHDLNLSRKTSVYSNTFMTKKMRFMSPITFISTARNENSGTNNDLNCTEKIPQKKHFVTNYGEYKF